jgi:hypothetical protein
MSLIRACLHEVERQWKAEMDLYVDKNQGGLTDQAWDTVDNAETRRLKKGSFFAKARRRTGKKNFPAVAQVGLMVAGGQFDDFDEDPKTKTKDQHETVFRKALGFDPEWQVAEDSLAPRLAKLSSVHEQVASSSVGDFSDEELIQARNIHLAFVAMLKAIVALKRTKKLPADEIAIASNALVWADPRDALEQAVTLWIRLRRGRTDLCEAGSGLRSD